MTKRYMDTQTSDAYSLLDHASDLAAYLHIGYARPQELFSAAMEQSGEVEREHRRLGRAFTSGRCGYHLSTPQAARLIVVQRVTEASIDTGILWNAEATQRF